MTEYVYMGYGFTVYFFLIFLTVYERHSGTVISTHASQQEDPGLDS